VVAIAGCASVVGASFSGESAFSALAARTHHAAQQLNNEKSELWKGSKPMGLFSKDIKTMNDLFVHMLRDIYYAEQAITQSLPDLVNIATDPQLKRQLKDHLGETENHVARLEEVFRLYGARPKAIDCPAIDGIIEEAVDLTSEVKDKQVLDAAIIAAAQAVEHYEITRYGTLIAWAKQLARDDCASILQRTLAEEKAEDERLTAMAESKINRKAA